MRWPLEAPCRIVEAVENTARPEHQPRRSFEMSDPLSRLLAALSAGARRVGTLVKTQRMAKRLRVCESVSLGDKRFLAIVQADDERILVAGSASSISVLTKLAEPKSFASVLDQHLAEKPPLE